MLIVIYCGWCEMFFFVCRSCWSGQVYCCSECRLLAKRMQRRRRSTEAPKKAGERVEKPRRGDERDEIATEARPPDASEKIPLWLAVVVFLLKKAAGKNRGRGEKAFRCLFCGARGRIVEAFPARGCGTNAAACGAG